MTMKLEHYVDKNIKSRVRFRTISSMGLMVELSTLGAGIQNIALIISEDPLYFLNLVLSYPDDEQLIQSGSYAGRTLCPNAGRISSPGLSIHGQHFPLEANEGRNQLHGGAHNLSFSDWKVAETETGTDFVRVTFTASQPDGMDGYPGNREYSVSYTIEDMGCITINYCAVSDRPTYINMSNHTYWNLHGIKAISGEDPLSPYEVDITSGNRHTHRMISGLDQLLEINANNVMLNKDDHLPSGMIPVSGTPFDFRTQVSLGQMLHSDQPIDHVFHKQIKTARGYNHAYLLAKTDLRRKFRGVNHYESIKKACTLQDPFSHRKLTLMTDAQAIVLYSGGFLADPSLFIALEAQDIPDVCNILPEYMKITDRDHPFQRRIRFHIG
ncbi:galactose mutarotase-like enzyme [Lachnospiraceae bacterium JC7]|nr:galactose mutarotase-like enzyme [Lachnospiraceae bacterium JC7]